ncbi:MAG: Kelch repeat-containing protein, partial [Nocardioidaceae bacterium]
IAPGYAYAYDGASTGFEGWTDKTPQDGWTVTDNEGNDETWAFDDPGDRGNLTGGDGNFAIIDSLYYGFPDLQDTSLVSPVLDLSDTTSPDIGFDDYYKSYYVNAVADVDLSLDGGQTWANVWEQTTEDASGHVDIPIPQAAGKSHVQVRFHYTGHWSWFWQVDNVFVGNRSCDPVDGGLVAGVVTDDNTGDGVNGAKVASDANADELAVSAATPDDANLSDGFYWLFSSHTGDTAFTVTKGRYAAASGSVEVPGGYVAHQDWTLGAGHLTIDPGSISVNERMGRHKTRTVTFSNDGIEPVHVNLAERDNGYTPMGGAHQTKAPGAPTKHVNVDPDFTAHAGSQSRRARAAHDSTAPSLRVNGHQVRLQQASPASGSWTPTADYPLPVMDNAVAYHRGKVYVIGGTDGGAANYADANVYDPDTQAWTSIADLPEPLKAMGAAFIGNTLYVVGGWNSALTGSTHTYAYHPGSDTWTQLSDMPAPRAAAGVAVLDGTLYVVGGCAKESCSPSTSSVFS